MEISKLDKITGYRRMLKLTQKDMANLLGISLSAYNKRENGYIDFSDKQKIIIRDIITRYFPNENMESLFF
jgi:ps3 protein 14-like transcriptional regulator